MKIEEAQKAAAAYCELYREIVKLTPIIRAILPKFDGKVYNKRMRTALDKAAEEKHGKELHFTFNQSANGQRVWIYGHKHMNYSNTSILCTIDLTDGKRIDAAQALKSCGEQYAEILKKCAEIERKAQEMPQIIERLDELAKLRDALTNGLPWELRDWFRIEQVEKHGKKYVYTE